MVFGYGNVVEFYGVAGFLKKQLLRISVEINHRTRPYIPVNGCADSPKRAAHAAITLATGATPVVQMAKGANVCNTC